MTTFVFTNTSIRIQWNLSIMDTLGTTWSVLIKEVSQNSEVVQYTSLCSWDNRQCPDQRGVLNSEVLNREVLLYVHVPVEINYMYVVYCLKDLRVHIPEFSAYDMDLQLHTDLLVSVEYCTEQ